MVISVVCEKYFKVYKLKKSKKEQVIKSNIPTTRREIKMSLIDIFGKKMKK
jgi:hypothetical protein